MSKKNQKLEKELLKKLYNDLEPEKKHIVDKLSKETGLKKENIIPLLARTTGFLLEIMGEALGGFVGIPLKVLSGIAKAIAVDNKLTTQGVERSVAEMKLSYCLLEDIYKEYSISKEFKGECFSEWVKQHLDKTNISKHYKIDEETLKTYEKLYQARNLSTLPEVEIVELLTSEKTKNIKGVEKIDCEIEGKNILKEEKIKENKEIEILEKIENEEKNED